LLIINYLNSLYSNATSEAINSDKWLTWSHKWFKLDYIGSLKSFKIGFNKYKKLFIEGKPNVFIVSNFFNANDILVSLSSYFKFKFDS
jgi:hypothetical protein